MYIYIYIYIYIARGGAPKLRTLRSRVGRTRGKQMHTRNRHLRSRRGFSAVFSNGCSVVLSNNMSLVCGIFRRFVTCPVDFAGNCQWMVSGIFQWIFTFVISGVHSFDPTHAVTGLGASKASRATIKITTKQCKNNNHTT